MTISMIQPRPHGLAPGSVGTSGRHWVRSIGALVASVIVAILVVAVPAQAEGDRTISGTVTLPAGSPASDYDYIKVFVGTDDPVTGRTSFDDGTRVERDGTYVISGLEPASYHVVFANIFSNDQNRRVKPNLQSRYYRGGALHGSGEQVDVTTESATGIDTTLERGSTQTVGFTSDLRALAREFHDAKAQLILQTADGEFIDWAPIDVDGPSNPTARFFGVAPGDYYMLLQIFTEGSGVVSQVVRKGNQPTWEFDGSSDGRFTAGFDWPDSELTGLYTPYGFSDSGVESLSGAATVHEDVDGTWVDLGEMDYVFDNEQRRWYSQYLPAGRYKVEYAVSEDLYGNDPLEVNGPLTEQWFKNASTIDSATVITLGSGESRKGIDGTIRPKSWQRPASGFVDITPETTQFATEITWMNTEGVSTGYALVDGEAQYKARSRVTRDAMAAFLYRAAGSPAFTAPSKSPFIDVSNNKNSRSYSPFYKEITWLASKGISTGWKTSKGAQYRPTQTIARDAMAAFLYRAAGSPAFTAPARSPFADVARTSPFYREITWMSAQGISTGTVSGGVTSYKPASPVLRDAMAAFLYRAYAD